MLTSRHLLISQIQCEGSVSTNRDALVFSTISTVIINFSNPFWPILNNPFPWQYIAPLIFFLEFISTEMFLSFRAFCVFFFFLLCFSLPALCFIFFCPPHLSFSFSPSSLSLSFSLVAFHSIFFHCFSFLSGLGTPLFFLLSLLLFRFSLFSFLNSCGTLREGGSEGEGREVSFSQSCRTKLPPTPHAVSLGMSLSLT